MVAQVVYAVVKFDLLCELAPEVNVIQGLQSSFYLCDYRTVERGRSFEVKPCVSVVGLS